MPAFLARAVRFSGCSLRIAARSFAKELMTRFLEPDFCTASKKTLQSKIFFGGLSCSYKNLTILFRVITIIGLYGFQLNLLWRS